MSQDVEFHSARALAELDQGMRAKNPRVAQAHLGLSALHLDRVRALAGGQARRA
jgi:hypothetical protein